MKREKWIDAVRGIGIILVIIGHCRRPEIVLKLIQSFHMPLFFFISGYLFRIKDCSFGQFFKHRLKLYIKPYIELSVINLFIWMIIKYKSGTENLGRLFVRYLIGLAYSRGTWYWMPNCSALWFLTALFCASIIMYFIVKRERKMQAALIFLCAVCTFAFCKAPIFKNPVLNFSDFNFETVKLVWNIDSAIWGVIFMYFGYMLRQLGFVNKVKNCDRLKLSLICVVLFTAGVSAAYFNPVDFISMDSMISGNILLAFLSMTCISLFVLIASCRLLNNSRLLGLFGRNTIYILGYNYLVNYFVYYLFGKFLSGLEFNMLWAVQCLVQIVLLTALACSLNYIKTKIPLHIKKSNINC